MACAIDNLMMAASHWDGCFTLLQSVSMRHCTAVSARKGTSPGANLGAVTEADAKDGRDALTCAPFLRVPAASVPMSRLDPTRRWPSPIWSLGDADFDSKTAGQLVNISGPYMCHDQCQTRWSMKRCTR